MNVTFKQFLAENEFNKLKKNKKPLTDEEREKVMKAKATWHNHPDPSKNPVSAVWKSVDKNGKVTYITNTHRAYKATSTLQGAINAYHNHIKGTA